MDEQPARPFYLAPGEATARYYTPLRIARFLKTIGIFGLLVGAFMFIRNFLAIRNSQQIDTDKLTQSIADAILKSQNPPAGKPNAPVYASGIVPPPAPPRPRSEVIEVKKVMTTAGYDYVHVDEDGNQLVGITQILTHLISKGYRIVNTLESTNTANPAMQIVVEK